VPKPTLAQHNFSGQDLQNLDQYIDSTLAEWQPPAMAIAIIKDDSVIYHRIHGVTQTNNGHTVNDQTLFAIGSATKAFTSTALGMLVDEGKIHWDDPVVRYLPDFRLKDDRISSMVTIRDLLSHRTGLSRTTLLFYNSGLSQEAMMHKLRYYDNAYPFRSGFGYQNVMFIVAGMIIEKVSGMPYEDFIKQRIFKPLEMNRSRLMLSSLDGEDNVATPHKKDGAIIKPIPWRNIDNAAPAGAIISDLEDMTHWVHFQLHNGMFNGKQLVKKETMQTMHFPQNIVNPPGVWKILNPQADMLYYGMGWFVQYFGDHKVVEHAGHIDGMSGHVAMMPDEGLAVIMLSNLDQNYSTFGIMSRIFNLYTHRPLHNYAGQIYRTLHPTGQETQTDINSSENQRIPNTKPSLDLKAYTGVFANNKFAQLSISFKDKKLIARFGNFEGPMEHWHHDTWKIHFNDPTIKTMFVTFTVNAKAKVPEATLEGIGPFKRTDT
jgi:CubicO group peptidase (beta-lactamase class C family)